MARGPSAETLQAAYDNDPKIKGIVAKWEKQDGERRAKAKARLDAAIAERAPLQKQYQSTRQRIAGLNATIQVERQNAKAHKMPAALRNQIGVIKSGIFRKLRAAHLRQARINFEQQVRKV